MTEEPIFARIRVVPLFDEWWWEVRRPDNSLYALGWSTDRKTSRRDATEIAEELRP